MSNTVKNISIGTADSSSVGGSSSELVSPDNTRRLRYRNGGFVIEATITATGFAGVENVDWEIISNL